MDFSGRVALITGAASGMGAATARAFAAAGGQVIIVDKNVVLSEQVASEIGSDLSMIGDISDSAFCNQAVENILSRHGRLDVLINAAGIIVRADAENTSDEQWQDIMGVNVNGLFFMSRAAIKPMKQQRHGVIVNFGSIWGNVGAAGVVAYCATKGAVHQITKAMALDHAKDGIRINAVCPGEVNTPMLQAARSQPVTPAFMKKLADTVPIGRLAEPAEIANIVLFLASDMASYMTGSLVTVDAGYTAR